ncbi:hypothetical protein [Magnetospira sp. QH-2]|uniref:hypothetical protein n=1 Tax=Magnetospira sp. (strain QH-2) TaxID=1288970 RepID=UPI0003E80E57|nr:hypothetical protein [Magnetospira sp. QH-2]CCQ74178.1 Protein of unknown function [Magnetospira sp. QH-2]
MAVLIPGKTSNTVSQYSSNMLLSQMQVQQQKKIQAESDKISNEYQTKINGKQTEIDSYTKLKADIGEVSTFLSKTVGQAKSILSNVDAMIRLVVSAEQTDSGYGNYGTTFDNFLKRLDATTESGGVTKNPLSRLEPDVFYKSSRYGGSQRVQGNYLGDSYQIIDSNDKVWIPDHQSKLLKQYNSYPDDPTNVNYSLEHGVRFDSVTGSSVTFTLNPDSGTPEALTGTLTGKGLEIVNAWYYENLNTTDGRTRAKADLDDAKAAAKVEVARYESAFAIAKYFEEKASTEAKGLTSDVNELLIERAQEVQQRQLELAQEFEAAQGRVVAAMSLKVDYQFMFRGLTGNNKVAQMLLSITA